MDETLSRQFVTLFRGRGDAYGSWDGGCVRDNVVPQHFYDHLDGCEWIGVYPNLGHQVVWGCSDIDYKEPFDAMNVYQALVIMGMHPWLEETVKGYHVWVFATGLVEAEHMRNMFLAAHQVANVNPKEVNPKQTELAPGQLGNYVRLPYPGGLAVRRMVRIDTAGKVDGYWELEDFISTALIMRVTPEQIAEVASYYQPPATPEVTFTEPTGDLRTAVEQLAPLGRVIFRDGPSEWRDRSTTLTHLAYECHNAGLPPSDALLILEEADWRWGKFMQRGQKGEQEVIKLVQRVYGNDPST